MRVTEEVLEKRCPACGGVIMLRDEEMLDGTHRFTVRHRDDNTAFNGSPCYFLGCYLKSKKEVLRHLNGRFAYIVYEDWGDYEENYQYNVYAFTTLKAAKQCALKHDERLRKKYGEPDSYYNFTGIDIVSFIDR